MKRQQCLERGQAGSDANLYSANWKQQSPAPEPHSRPRGSGGLGNVGGMHGFKGTTEQIRGPFLSTDGLSLISDGD
ncbi:hypothetical protein F2P81_014656 [Scophthalmus maximus]|uniref:Uncharacterized protein n=1 Tax=Scophthalmus maximus TaxID=52904 RepID=A0A6A4SAZ7_SCOMX|nr:hypothetical protein F2P81_014656 [Scophthalmus maximus]